MILKKIMPKVQVTGHFKTTPSGKRTYVRQQNRNPPKPKKPPNNNKKIK